MCESCRAGIVCALHPTWLMSDEELTAYIEKKVKKMMEINPGTMPKYNKYKMPTRKHIEREEEARVLACANREYREALSTRKTAKGRIKEISSRLEALRISERPDWGTIVSLGDEMTQLQYKLEAAEQRISVLGEDYKVVNKGGAISLALR